VVGPVRFGWVVEALCFRPPQLRLRRCRVQGRSFCTFDQREGLQVFTKIVYKDQSAASAFPSLQASRLDLFKDHRAAWPTEALYLVGIHCESFFKIHLPYTSPAAPDGHA
jgi:hypothetical protein